MSQNLNLSILYGNLMFLIIWWSNKLKSNFEIIDKMNRECADSQLVVFEEKNRILFLEFYCKEISFIWYTW